ncbi:MAG: ShlB/FhaC/HecB family hemolysin secretion/activation protein [Rhizomicrobium sp.]
MPRRHRWLLAVLLLWPGAVGAQTASQTVVVRRVEVTGSTLPQSELADATERFVGARLDRAGLQRVADAVSARYSVSDVAFFTVTVPSQDFAAGTVRLVVYEGFVEAVELHGDMHRNAGLAAAYGRRLAAERPLRRSKLERYVSFLRDVAGLTPDLKLLPGDRPGALCLSIALESPRPKFTLAVDNQGEPRLDRIELQAGATFYGLLRDGERTQLSYLTTTTMDRLQFVALSDSEVLDDDGTVARIGASFLRTRPQGTAGAGEAKTLQAAVAHTFLRSSGEDLTASFGLDVSRASDATYGAFHSSDRLRVLRALVSYAFSDADRDFALTAATGFGLDDFGAAIGPGFAGTAGFRKLALQATLNRALDAALVLRLKAVAQYGADRLPSSELYTFGGADIGAGFAPASISGDSAAGARVEIGYRAPWLPFRSGEFYADADGGASWLRVRPPWPTRYAALASVGGGLRLAFGETAALDLGAALGVVADAPWLRRGDWRFAFALRTQTD